MEQGVKKIGLINWLALLAAAAGMAVIARFAQSNAGYLAAMLAGVGALVGLISYGQMSLEAREETEKLEVEELSKGRGASLFASAGADTFPARRSREQFERFFVPALTVLLMLGEAAAAYFPWKYVRNEPSLLTERATLGMALLGMLGLILFLLGKYSSGLARLKKERLLRPGAACLLLTAYVCFIATATLGASLAGFPRADFVVMRVLCVVAGLMAVETLIALLLEIYRVRVKGKDARVLYESRLVGLLGQPEAIITTAAHTLDYQFGFKVSETWFYRFLERALAWLVLAQVAIMLASTCAVVIQPGEQALLERFGRPVTGREVLEPGWHFKMPWPVDRVYRYRTEQIQSFLVGAEPEMSPVIQWNAMHAKEDNFLVGFRPEVALTNITVDTNANAGRSEPPSVNLLAVSIPVQYQITNLTWWAYTNDNPGDLLSMIARREVVRFLAGVDLNELMTVGRAGAAETVRAAIQQQSDQLHLGVKITFLGMEDIHPPVKVADDYGKVVNAREDKEVKILDAQTHDITTNAEARGAAFKRLAEAEAIKEAAVTNSAARANLFSNQSLAYAAAPGADGVYEHRAYLNMLIQSTANAQRKIMLGTESTNIIYELNEEEKIRSLGDELTFTNR